MKISPLQFLTRAQQDRMTELRAEIASIREDAAADAADFAKLSLSAHGAAVTAWSKRSVKCGGSARRNVKVIRITEHSVYTSNGRGKPVRWRLSDGRAIGIGMDSKSWTLEIRYSPEALLNAIVARGGTWADRAQSVLKWRGLKSANAP